MYYHLAVPARTEAYFRYACIKGRMHQSWLIGRKPVTDMKRSGMEVCAA